ncbi:MAG: GNAT family N-acetyltransferase [Myxococcaceae bacterium]|nr:GNAT family N-acetyltransferase [Myxococcaceae bacterium]
MHTAQAPQLVFREVTPDRWKDFARLFERRGGPSYCWCMAWRATGPEARKTDKASKKAAMSKRVRGGVPVGLLGYLGDEPMAWCSIAPRETYRPLGGPEEPSQPGAVWSLACFFIDRRLRGQGVTRQLIAAAVAHAKAQGASVVEAYPVDPDSPSYRFMGFVPTFRQVGFQEVGLAGTRRHVMRLTLD